MGVHLTIFGVANTIGAAAAVHPGDIVHGPLRRKGPAVRGMRRASRFFFQRGVCKCQSPNADAPLGRVGHDRLVRGIGAGVDGNASNVARIEV